MKQLTFLFVSALTTLACHPKMHATATAGGQAPIPVCIQQKIDSIKQQPVWNPPATIEEYEYAGKKVYLTSANCCDFFSTVSDENCNYICAPSGGFTGRGDGLCKDFNDKARLVKIVWKDERSKK